MKNIVKFAFKLQKIDVEIYAEPPEDPLGELSDFQMGMRRFCYEHNRQILIEIGDEKKRVFLEPDMALILERLPDKISKLAEGQPIEIDFTESCHLILKFLPQGDVINCTFKEFGRSLKQKQFQLDRQQVLETLTNFLRKIIDGATEKGYIKRQEINEFVVSALAL